jgi:hypothetical protein
MHVSLDAFEVERQVNQVLRYIESKFDDTLNQVCNLSFPFFVFVTDNA